MKTAVMVDIDSHYGLEVLYELSSRDIQIDSIVALRQPLKFHKKNFHYIRDRVGLFQAIFFGARKVVLGMIRKSTGRCLQDYLTSDINKLGGEIFFSKSASSVATASLLKSLEPDVLVIGSTGIVRKNILDIPRIGTINAHPAILPQYRGLDCAKWAILQNRLDKIGATVHWVNLGVDMGNIIRTEVSHLQAGDNFRTLEQRLERICCRLLADVIVQLKGGDIPYGVKQFREQGRQYYKMSILGEVRSARALRLAKPDK